MENSLSLRRSPRRLVELTDMEGKRWEIIMRQVSRTGVQPGHAASTWIRSSRSRGLEEKGQKSARGESQHQFKVSIHRRSVHEHICAGLVQIYLYDVMTKRARYQKRTR